MVMQESHHSHSLPKFRSMLWLLLAVLLYDKRKSPVDQLKAGTNWQPS